MLQIFNHRLASALNLAIHTEGTAKGMYVSSLFSSLNLAAVFGQIKWPKHTFIIYCFRAQSSSPSQLSSQSSSYPKPRYFLFLFTQK